MGTKYITACLEMHLHETMVHSMANLTYSYAILIMLAEVAYVLQANYDLCG
jgi:hypothetical protein